MTQLQMIRRLEGKWKLAWNLVGCKRERGPIFSEITPKKVPLHMHQKENQYLGWARAYLSENKETVNYKVVSTWLECTAGQHAWSRAACLRAVWVQASEQNILSWINSSVHSWGCKMGSWERSCYFATENSQFLASNHCWFLPVVCHCA